MSAAFRSSTRTKDGQSLSIWFRYFHLFHFPAGNGRHINRNNVSIYHHVLGAVIVVTWAQSVPEVTFLSFDEIEFTEWRLAAR
jgi:hypothetical protein